MKTSSIQRIASHRQSANKKQGTNETNQSFKIALVGIKAQMTYKDLLPLEERLPPGRKEENCMNKQPDFEYTLVTP